LTPTPAPASSRTCSIALHSAHPCSSRWSPIGRCRCRDIAVAGDLVITADIPLAAAVVGKGASALNPRGELYTRDNVQGLLDMRNFMDTLRSSGVETGGPAALSNNDRQAFAAQLNRWIARQFKPQTG
jgi:uncharacterized protein YaiI (UPF0178 family)